VRYEEVRVTLQGDSCSVKGRSARDNDV